jgi:hypothetical protein
MFTLSKGFCFAAVLGVAGLAWAVPAARAQSPYFQVRPGLTLQQLAFNVSTLGQALQNVPPYVYGINPYPRVVVGGSPYAGMGLYGNMYSNPYAASQLGSYGSDPYTASMYGGGGYGGYGYYYYPNPFADILRGEASLTTAQGQFMVSQQQAYQMREQVRQEKVNTRRKLFDEYMYEREKTPTTEEERQRFMLEQANRSRNNPPVTEIWSGKALNDLIADVRKHGAKTDTASMRTFQVPLDEDALKHINVTKGIGNIGLLKNEGRLNWPVALSDPAFKEERERVNSLAHEAVSQAGFNGSVDAGTIRQLSADADKLRKQLRKISGDLSPSLYIEANTFLNNLNDAIRALQQPDVGNYFTGKFALKAKTVPELLRMMADNGLQFAPAVPGDESAYAALHQALASYDRMANTQVVER